MAGMQRAGVSAKDVLVTDFTPEYAGKTTATGYLGGTWVAVNKEAAPPTKRSTSCCTFRDWSTRWPSPRQR
jgi:hypothetical protein